MASVMDRERPTGPDPRTRTLANDQRSPDASELRSASIHVSDTTVHPLTPDTLNRRQRRVLLTMAVLAVVAPIGIGAAIFVPDAGRLLTESQFWFVLHLTFGIIIVHSFAAGMGMLVTRTSSRLKEAVRLASTASLALVSWATVISGTWFVYPDYRAEVPPGGQLENYPQQYLAENGLSFWHEFGMQWKEHVGWVTPILATAVAYVVYRHGHVIQENQRARVLTAAFFGIAFLAALIAAGLGAVINVTAPNEFLRS